MSEADQRNDAFRSALERLPVAVIVVDAQRRLQPWNSRATELFEAENLRGDLLASRPAHPLAAAVNEILAGRSFEERTSVFPSGVTYRISPSRQSPKGIGRWLLLLVSRADDRLAVNPGSLPLTPRETEVVRLLLDGKTSDEICSELSFGRATLKTHLQRLFVKTGARTRAELVSRLLRRH